MNVLPLRILLARVLWLDSERVSTKVIPLCLKQIGRKVLGAVAIKEAESSTKGWRGNPPQGTFADNVSPAWLSMADSFLEEIVEQQVLEVGVTAVSGSDVLEKDRADDATTTPHKSD